MCEGVKKNESRGVHLVSMLDLRIRIPSDTPAETLNEFYNTSHFAFLFMSLICLCLVIIFVSSQ